MKYAKTIKINYYICKMLYKLKIIFKLLRAKHFFAFALNSENLELSHYRKTFKLDRFEYNIPEYNTNLIVQQLSNSLDSDQMALDRAEIEAEFELWRINEN